MNWTPPSKWLPPSLPALDRPTLLLLIAHTGAELPLQTDIHHPIINLNSTWSMHNAAAQAVNACLAGEPVRRPCPRPTPGHHPGNPLLKRKSRRNSASTSATGHWPSSALYAILNPQPGTAYGKYLVPHRRRSRHHHTRGAVRDCHSKVRLDPAMAQLLNSIDRINRR